MLVFMSVSFPRLDGRPLDSRDSISNCRLLNLKISSTSEFFSDPHRR